MPSPSTTCLLLLCLLPQGGGGCATTAPATPTAPEPDSLTETLDQMARSSAEEPASWQTTSSTNFTLHHHVDATTAQRLVAQAEQRRGEQLRWWGRASEDVWQPKCDIFLYATQRQMQRMQRGRHFHASTIARSAQLARRLILQRQINLFAGDRLLVTSSLPHELSHVVLTELLANRHLPRWADEGLATHWEAASLKRRRQLGVLRSLRAQRIFSLRSLLQMTGYPDSREDKLLYYAQAHALVGLLLRLRPKKTFLAFLEQISPANVARRSPTWETVLAGLQKHYGIASEQALKQRWVAFVQAYAPR